LRFDSVKAALLKAPDSRLINEVEISFGGNPGAEFEIENKDTTITTRVLMIDQRFFQLTVVNRGRTSQATERVRNFNRKNIDRFINSFSVTQLPAPKIAAVELPPDFGIKIQDDTFTSDFFGFSIKLPTAWKIVEKEQTNVYKDLSVMSAENASENVKKSLDVSLKNTEILLMMTKSQVDSSINEAVFAISAEKVSFPNFLPVKVAESFVKTFTDQDKIVMKSPTSITLSGVDFAFVEINNVEKNYKERIYFANRKGIAFEILLIYKTEEDLKTLTDSLQTMKFAEKNQ
jgi:hypothetical protein